MGVHRIEVKLKEAIRLGDYIPFSTKEKEFGLQGTIHWGESD